MCRGGGRCCDVNVVMRRCVEAVSGVKVWMWSWADVWRCGAAKETVRAEHTIIVVQDYLEFLLLGILRNMLIIGVVSQPTLEIFERTRAIQFVGETHTAHQQRLEVVWVDGYAFQQGCDRSTFILVFSTALAQEPDRVRMCV